MTVPVITIDGPSGAGKGTIRGLLAAQLGWHELDSGALYRALAYAVNQAAIPSEQESSLLAELALTLPVVQRSNVMSGLRTYLAEEDITEAIRHEAIGMLASRISAYPSVRAALIDRQRAYRISPGLVTDGRDMGTVVFPDAFLKVFLTASPVERARRRHLQLMEAGEKATITRLTTELVERDLRDRVRAASPLIPAADAIVIDTSGIAPDVICADLFNVVTTRL